MDYRKFLQAKDDEGLRLPYFTGLKVCDDRRVYRLRSPLDPGWYQFRLRGRCAEAQAAIEPDPNAWKLQRISGYLMNQQLITDRQCVRLFGLPQDEEFPRFSSVVAWRWFDGSHGFESLNFESETEAEVRSAYEEDRSINHLKGVTPALAHTFLLESTKRLLTRERACRIRLQAEEAVRRQAEEVRRRSLESRFSQALSQTGAELADWRRLSAREAVVRYRLNASRFECVVDMESLQIIDAGICLEGTDRELNLTSLPAAVHEAQQTGQLYVFRD